MAAKPDVILVVDDDPYITDLLTTALRYEGFAIDAAATGTDALARIRSSPPALVLLDVMLPDVNGTEICRMLRNEGCAVPVVFLTARDATEDKVSGLSLADDYVTKPFSLAELVARVRAVLRRSLADQADSEILGFADLVMNVDRHEVRRGEVEMELTATEFNLLRYLLENARRVVSKSEILDHVWEYESGDVNIVETYISYLRKKLDEVDPPLIHTVRGVGYCLRVQKDVRSNGAGTDR